MFNWIAMNLVNFIIANRPMMLATAWGESSGDRTPTLMKSQQLLKAVLPRAGLDKLEEDK